MPNFAGRKFLIKKGSAVIASVRSKTVTINGEPIDVTNDDDDGYRRLLDDPATRSVDISVEGLMDADTLRAAALGVGTLKLTDISVEWPDGATMTGDFFLTNVEETGAHNDAAQFSASFQSSGQWTYTAA